MLLPMFEASLRAVLSTQLPAVMKCEVREDCAGIAQERPHEANQKQEERRSEMMKSTYFSDSSGAGDVRKIGTRLESS